MASLIVEIPSYIKTKFGITNNISYEKLIIKTIGREYISPDLNFTSYDNMSDIHKKEYDKLENVNKSCLLNI